MAIRDKFENWLGEIYDLSPTDEEMEQFVSYLENTNQRHGTVSYNSNPNRYYDGPFIHDTYRKKWGGRMHIDTGYPGVHIMLDRHMAPYFIIFIRNLRV